MPQSLMPLHRHLMALVAAAGLLTGSGAAVAASGSGLPSRASAGVSLAQLPAAVVEQNARAAAERVLQALRDGDANARYAQFAPRLQRVSSPAMVQSHLAKQPKLLSWTITGVVPGMESSLVEVNLVTAVGPKELTLAINSKGLLEGYHFNAANQPAEKVARDFVEALAQGRFVLANSFLEANIQQEISPAALQVKWQALQRLTGNFVQVRKAFQAESSDKARLVLVNTEFNRLNDNLFVILNNRNEIVNVDFPVAPNPPAPVP